MKCQPVDGQAYALTSITFWFARFISHSLVPLLEPVPGILSIIFVTIAPTLRFARSVDEVR